MGKLDVPVGIHFNLPWALSSSSVSEEPAGRVGYDLFQLLTSWGSIGGFVL